MISCDVLSDQLKSSISPHRDTLGRCAQRQACKAGSGPINPFQPCHRWECVQLAIFGVCCDTNLCEVIWSEQECSPNTVRLIVTCSRRQTTKIISWVRGEEHSSHLLRSSVAAIELPLQRVEDAMNSIFYVIGVVVVVLFVVGRLRRA